LIQKFQESGAIIARKFRKGTISVQDWESLVLRKNQENSVLHSVVEQQAKEIKEADIRRDSIANTESQNPTKRRKLE
jgi:hypothetical protein